MPDRVYGAVEARLANVESEIQRVRARVHDLASLEAVVTMLGESVRDFREAVETLPVTEERVTVLSAEMKNVKKALWSFTFALVGSAIGFAFFAIQIATS